MTMRMTTMSMQRASRAMVEHAATVAPLAGPVAPGQIPWRPPGADAARHQQLCTQPPLAVMVSGSVCRDRNAISGSVPRLVTFLQQGAHRCHQGEERGR